MNHRRIPPRMTVLAPTMFRELVRLAVLVKSLLEDFEDILWRFMI